MERRHLGRSYYGTADAGQNDFLLSPTPEDVIFYEGIVSGRAGNLASYSPTCVVPESGLEALHHGFEGWTNYTSDDCVVGYSGVNLNPTTASPTYIQTDSYFSSLNQSEAVDDIGEEMPSCSHYSDMFSGLSACDLSTYAERGREKYSEALGQWSSADIPEAEVYDPFRTAALLQQQQQQQNRQASVSQPTSMLASSSGMHNVMQQSAESPYVAAIPEMKRPLSKPKPSYSEVAKHSCCELKAESKQKLHQGDPKQKLKRVGGTVRDVHSYHMEHPSKCSPSHKSSDLGPKTIQPNSHYGLDTFEDPVFHALSANHLCSTKHSLPTCKDSGSSLTASNYCAVEELDASDHSKRCDDKDSVFVNSSVKCDHRVWVRQNCDTQKQNCALCSVKNDIRSRLVSEKKTYDVPTSVSDANKVYKSNAQCESKSVEKTNKAKNNGAKSHEKDTFFDPKRIFNPIKSKPVGKRSQQPASTTNSESFLPNNSHASNPKQHGVDTVLNNDKPSAKPSSNINKSCYINNNLRESTKTSNKKQANANAQQSSVNVGHSSARNHSKIDQSQSDADCMQSPRLRESVTSTYKDKSQGKTKAIKTNEDQPFLLGDLISALLHCGVWLAEELGHILWNVTKLVISIGLALLLTLVQNSVVTLRHVWMIFSAKFPSSGSEGESVPKKTLSHEGLQENISLPSTGEEAMKRLLANKGKDPYSILGIRSDVSDDMIKKYYRRQAVLVHPDKNQMPGAEEAFKILGQAFDLIGEPEKRKLFDTQRMESQEKEEAFYEFADLLNKLHEKMQEAANTMRCDNCGGKHRRIQTERHPYAARYCQKCNYNHQVREGDVWAESYMLGFRWNYYACMEGKIYDITEWASCQPYKFKHIQANAHHIAYRIATQSNTGGRHRHNRSNEADLEDFLNQFFHQGADTMDDGSKFNGSTNSSQFGASRPSQPSWNKPSNLGTNRKGRRKKKRH